MSLSSNVLIPLGISVADRAKLLGHSVATNLNHYSYAQKDYLKSARALMNHESQKNEKSHNDFVMYFRLQGSDSTPNTSGECGIRKSLRKKPIIYSFATSYGITVTTPSVPNSPYPSYSFGSW